MIRVRGSALLGILALAGIWMAGCNALKTDKTRFLDPSQVVLAPKEGAPINPILSNASPADQTQELFPNSTFPRPEDWQFTDQDYIIGALDILDISVLDLYQEGLETLIRRQVSMSGFIDLPLIPQNVKAEGLTSDQLKEAIIRAYSPDILLEPTVSVIVQVPRQNVFSMLGSISRPGTYNISRKGMRLLEAMAVGGGVTQTNLKYIYVIRHPGLKPAAAAQQAHSATQKASKIPALPGFMPGGEVELPPLPEIPGMEGAQPLAPKPDSEPMPLPQIEAPNEQAPPPAILPPLPEEPSSAQPPVAPPQAASAPKADERLDELNKALGPQTAPRLEPQVMPGLAEFANGPAGQAAAPDTFPAGSIPKIVYSDGEYIVVEQQAGVATQPSGEGAEPVRPKGMPETPREQPQPGDELARVRGLSERDPFGWSQSEADADSRIIAVDLTLLNQGDPQMNIAVRDNDVIYVPTLDVGEFYVFGEVLRPGVYPLTGRQVTIKQAITFASGLNPLAWPSNSVLIRRIADNQEQIIPLDLEAIFRGKQPDMFLKPNDIIAVGSDYRTNFYAVIRNAFRMTYGFGFIYDRNFNDPVSPGLNSKRFTRF